MVLGIGFYFSRRNTNTEEYFVGGRRFRGWVIGLSLVVCGMAPPETVLEQITFDEEGSPRTISGRVVVKAVDGGLLVQERDGRLWTVPAEVLQKRVTTQTPFRSETSKDMGKRLVAELDRSVAPGFHVPHALSLIHI